jgi:hypothetical protein
MTDNQGQILINNKFEDILIVLTTKYLLLFIDINKELEYKELLRITKAVSSLPKFELILKKQIEDIENIKHMKNGEEYKFKDGNYIVLNSEEISDYLISKYKV